MHSVRQTNRKERRKKERPSSQEKRLLESDSHQEKFITLLCVCVCVLEGRSFLTSYGILLLPISILSVPYSYFFFYLFKKSFAFIYSFRVSVSQSVCGRRTTVSLSLCSFFSLFLFPSALFVVFLFFPSHRQDTR